MIRSFGLRHFFMASTAAVLLPQAALAQAQDMLRSSHMQGGLWQSPSPAQLSAGVVQWAKSTPGSQMPGEKPHSPPGQSERRTKRSFQSDPNSHFVRQESGRRPATRERAWTAAEPYPCSQPCGRNPRQRRP